MDNLIITVAPVGAGLTKEDFPDLPITPDEIADEIYRCWNAGAAVAHIHARKPDGSAIQDKNVYREIIQKTRDKCDIIIQVSTGGEVGMEAEERIDPLDAKPEMASLTLGTVNFGDEVFMNPRGLIETFARTMRQKGVKPELEIFDMGMIRTGLTMLKQGLLDEPLHWSFIMGISGGIGGDLSDLVHMAAKLPSGHTWQVGGIGRYQLPMGNCAISMGGHVRVGAEDNIYYRKGQKIKSSAEMVEKMVQLANVLERPIASPNDARQLLSLPAASN